MIVRQGTLILQAMMGHFVPVEIIAKEVLPILVGVPLAASLVAVA